MEPVHVNMVLTLKNYYWGGYFYYRTGSCKNGLNCKTLFLGRVLLIDTLGGKNKNRKNMIPQNTVSNSGAQCAKSGHTPSIFWWDPYRQHQRLNSRKK